MIARPVEPAATRALRQAVLRPHQTLEEMAAHEEPGRHYVGVEDGGALIAVGSIAPEGPPGSWRVRGMATAPAARGRGAGAAVLHALLQHARAHGGTRAWCNARTGARAFYEREGFAVEGEEFELPEIGPHFVMSRTI